MNTRTTLIALLILASNLMRAQHTVTVTIEKLENSQGLVMIELLDQNEKTVEELAVPITNETSTFSFTDVESGTYAIRYFHDENENGKMDTGSFGIPKEGYGFSNNARGFMGPPDFEDMLFEVKGDLKLTLKTVN
jgi:uncharacterized protein (DUF2141 family)